MQLVGFPERTIEMVHSAPTAGRISAPVLDGYRAGRGSVCGSALIDAAEVDEVGPDDLAGFGWPVGHRVDEPALGVRARHLARITA